MDPADAVANNCKPISNADSTSVNMLRIPVTGWQG